MHFFIKFPLHNYCHLRKIAYICKQVRPIVVNDSLLRQASCRPGKYPERRVAVWFSLVNNSISYLFRVSWNVGNFIEVSLWVSQPMPVLYGAGMTYIYVIQVILRPHDTREESSLRFFCVLGSLGVTCKQTWRYSFGALLKLILTFTIGADEQRQ